jgi:hypothetical protein
MNTKMKVLALALLGLAGYAGSAVAGGCPGSPVPPWTAVDALGGTATIAAGGYAGTACRLDSTLTGDASSFATVEDDTPSSEPRYRGGFIINVDNLVNLGAVAASDVLTISSDVDGSTAVELSIIGDGAGGRYLSYSVIDSAAGGFDVGTLPLTAGENRVQFDVDNGSVSGTPHFSIWVNNTNEASPDFTTTTFNNGGIVVDTAYLGLAGATPAFLAAPPNGFRGVAVGFDQFDSRRSTFITW